MEYDELERLGRLDAERRDVRVRAAQVHDDARVRVDREAEAARVERVRHRKVRVVPVARGEGTAGAADALLSHPEVEDLAALVRELVLLAEAEERRRLVASHGHRHGAHPLGTARGDRDARALVVGVSAVDEHGGPYGRAAEVERDSVVGRFTARESVERAHVFFDTLEAIEARELGDERLVEMRRDRSALRRREDDSLARRERERAARRDVHDDAARQRVHVVARVEVAPAAAEHEQEREDGGSVRHGRP